MKTSSVIDFGLAMFSSIFIFLVGTSLAFSAFLFLPLFSIYYKLYPFHPTIFLYEIHHPTKYIKDHSLKIHILKDLILIPL